MIMGFSELTKGWQWLTCSLCDKQIVLIKEKIKDEESVLCVKCLMVELKLESETIRMEIENDQL